MDAAKIKENIRQREICDYVYEFIRDTIIEENFDDPKRFAQLLIDLIAFKHLDQAGAKGAMTVDEAREFEKQSMPFGEYVTQPIINVPLDRLQWYADQRFVDDLWSYLKSRIVQQELEVEERYTRNKLVKRDHKWD